MSDSPTDDLDDVLHALASEDADSAAVTGDRAHVIAGRYEIVEELGAGGMGRVLLVKHQRLGKPFALKLMQADFSQHPEAEKIFHREAQLASHLSHPNIVEVVDFGYDPDWGWFIAMEYLKGEPLSTHTAKGHLPVPVVCDIAMQLADALRHSHQKGVVHADVKSENVLVLESGPDDRRHWQIKLLDFGTAQFSAGHEAPERPASRVTGTPEYLAPERIMGGPSQPSNDLYSLGIIMFEMLAGAPPFTGDPGTILVRHLSATPEPAGARRGEVLDARLDAIVEKALAKDPQQRYASAEELMLDLRGYMDVIGLQRRSGTAAPSVVVQANERVEAAVAAFDAMLLPVAGVRREGTIMVANASFARWVGATPEAVIGRNVRGTFLARLNPHLQDDLRVVALNGKTIKRDLIVRREGRSTTVRYVLSPAPSACGHCVLVLYPV